MSPSKAANRTPYKPPRQTGEIVKAVLAATAVVVGTAVAIFLLQPDDSSSTPSPTPVVTAPAGSPDSTPASTTATTTAPTTGSTPSGQP
jgi:hypothetical protein